MMNELKANWLMKDLIKFLKDNPLNFKLYNGDVPIQNESNYIFLDIAQQEPIAFNDGGVLVSNIVINIYALNYADRSAIVKYVLTKLFGNVTYRRDEQYFVATIDRKVFINAL